MLVATYSLVAIAAEQKNVRFGLSKLQENIQNSLHGLTSVNRISIESALNKLVLFEENCHKRKVEIYLIPAIRNATRQADPVFAKLESLSAKGLRLLQSMQEQLRFALKQGKLEINKLCVTMDRYCRNLLTRLNIEEEELLPIAGRVLSTEEWFSIGAKFLSDDAGNNAHSRTMPIHYTARTRSQSAHSSY